ncbi:MAG: hypothetical protein LBR38_01550 [Synergistaceae bacterium]|nr:hypothetical protein [Synergistaceae bacterium]
MASLMESMDRGESEMYESVFQRVYTAEGMAQGMAQGIEKGMAQGIEKGIAQGMAKGRAKVALSMLNDGLPLETVRKYTGFTDSEIARLKTADV